MSLVSFSMTYSLPPHMNVYSYKSTRVYAFSKQTLEKLAPYYQALMQISAKFSTHKNNYFTFI